MLNYSLASQCICRSSVTERDGSLAWPPTRMASQRMAVLEWAIEWVCAFVWDAGALVLLRRGMELLVLVPERSLSLRQALDTESSRATEASREL